jgi:lipopolysaccharide biosynthesis glycosyltransferase
VKITDRNTIVLCLDTNYESFAITLIEQMLSLEDNFASKFNFQILCLSQVSLKRLDFFLEGKKISHEFSFIDFSMTQEQKLGMHHPESAYLKLFIGKALHSSAIEPSTKVLYLDVDILLQQSISFIFSRFAELDDDSMIAARIEKGRHLHHQLFYNFEEYFNTGVMFLDYMKMYNSKLSEEFLDLLDIHGALPMADQDYFNIILNDSGALNELPTEFNHLFQPFDNYAQLAYIVHFAGSSKPWNKFGWNKFYASWRRHNNVNFKGPYFPLHLRIFELFVLLKNVSYSFIFPFYLKVKNRMKVI